MHYYEKILFMLLIFHQPKYHVHVKHNICLFNVDHHSMFIMASTSR